MINRTRLSPPALCQLDALPENEQRQVKRSYGKMMGRGGENCQNPFDLDAMDQHDRGQAGLR